MKQILLIEDDAGVMKALKRLLRGYGHVVIGVSDGADGVSLALTQTFDLIITANDVPTMNGCEVIREILIHKPEANIWLTSNRDEPETFTRALRLGAKEAIKALQLSTLMKERNLLL